MKKTLLATSMVLAMGVSGSASAITALTAGDYWMEITGGCFDFGNCTVTNADSYNDNTLQAEATISGFGSGIANDGVSGKIAFTLDATGAFVVTSYSQDSYLDTTGGTFYLQDQDDLGSLMSGTICNDCGSMQFDPTGRDGIAAKFAGSLGLQPWNIDNTTDGLGTGLWETFTTGTSANRAQGFVGGFTITGSPLVDAGTDMWTGTLVSAGNIGQNWGDFNNTQYSEVWDIKITKHVIPVPAAVWLFGSGLVGLVGVARRKRA